MKPLAIIERAASKIAPGRAPHFIEAHLVKTLMLIDTEGPIGRMKLSRSLELGEGTTRTLTRHLEKEGLIKSSRAGISLTNSGKRFYSNLRSTIAVVADIPQSSLTVAPFNVAILVKDSAGAVGSGLEQRDAAIMIGATGATTLVFSHGKLKMPLVDEAVFREASTICKELICKLKPQEDDVIIIGSAGDKLTAELGAIAATVETLRIASGFEKRS